MWITPNAATVLSAGFSPAEQAQLAKLQNSSTVLATVVANTVQEVRDSIRAGGYNLAPDSGTVPGGLTNDFIAIAVWLYVTSLPGAQQLATDYRKELLTNARAKLERIAEQKFSPEDPTDAAGSRTGNWNSENKLIPRMHPVPPPATQFPTDTAQNIPNAYANPSAPADTGGAAPAPPDPVTANLPLITVFSAGSQALFANTGFQQLSASINAQAGVAPYVATFTLPTAGVLAGAFVDINIAIDPSANPTVNIADGNTGTVLQTLTNPAPAQAANWFGQFVLGQDGKWHKMIGEFQ